MGIVAAFIGTWLAGALGISTNTPGIDWLELLVQVVVAAIGVVVAANLWVRRGVRGRRSPMTIWRTRPGFHGEPGLVAIRTGIAQHGTGSP